jgi:hypothetical protein
VACSAPAPCTRAIAACQKSILASGMLAVGPTPKHGKPDAIRARAK